MKLRDKEVEISDYILEKTMIALKVLNFKITLLSTFF